MKAEFQDHKTEIRQKVKTIERYACKDALWVKCPWDALELTYCGKPEVPCPHRGALKYKLVITPTLVDAEKEEEIPIQQIDVFGTP